jgi:hypothetical protein
MNIEIEKTGEMLELNLADTFSLVKFIKYVMVWDVVDDYLSFSDEKIIPLSYLTISRLKDYTFTIYPRSVLVPTSRYSYSLKKVSLRLRVPMEPISIVSANTPIRFESYRFLGYFFDDQSEVKIGVTLGKPDKYTGKIEVERFAVEVGGIAPDNYYYPLFFRKDNAEIRNLEDGLNALIHFDGKRFNDLINEHPASQNRIESLENILFISINLIYSIYNREFRENSFEYKAFSPFAKLLRSYGESFKEVLPKIKEVTAHL